MKGPFPHARLPAGGPPGLLGKVFGGTGLLAAVLVMLGVAGSRAAPAPDPVAGPLPLPSALVDGRLPMEVNERVERWIQRFLTTDRVGFETYLVREGLYGEMIRDRLRRRGMPEELLYLAMIESGFSPAATSPMLASGVWQFMAQTARQHGLAVDAWVDERRDPVRATDAALDYLEQLHDMFGSWYLAAAAYNAGPGRVAAALRSHGASEGGDEALYWRIIHDLPPETRDYVPKLLAAALLAERGEHFGIEVERSLPYTYDRVLVPGGTSLTRVAQTIDVPAALLRELNPHLIRGITPPGRSFQVRIPEGKAPRVVAGLRTGQQARWFGDD